MPRMPVKPGTRRAAPRPTASRRSIVWLASYPKSGNTWTRIFLANYLIGGDTPIPINEVHRLGMGDSVSGAYRKVNGGQYDPADYKTHLKLREQVMRGITANGADLNFVKTHNINDHAFGTRLIDPMFTRSAIYIVRDPRDVVLSYARHYAQSVPQACDSLSRSDNTTAADATSVMQYLGNWSDHVRGWTKARGFPVHTMRYEDMKADAPAAFRALLEFLGLPVEDERLERAVRFSSFDELKAQEEKSGFIERSASTESSFFHSGTSGQWEGKIPPEDLARLEKTHAKVMREFGYL